jgi:hypothetical protein
MSYGPLLALFMLPIVFAVGIALGRWIERRAWMRGERGRSDAQAAAQAAADEVASKKL